VLNEIIRTAFLELHGRPLLQEFHQDLKIHLGSVATIPDLPKQGTLDLKRVKESRYIFS